MLRRFLNRSCRCGHFQRVGHGGVHSLDCLIWLPLVLLLLAPVVVLADPGPAIDFDLIAIDEEVAVLALQSHETANVGAYEFELLLDGTATYIEAVDVPVSFLAGTGRTAQPLGPYLMPDGTFLAAGGYSYGTQVGVDGNHTLATITMTLSAPGLTALNLYNAALVAPDATVLLTTTEQFALHVDTVDVGWNLRAPCVDLAGQDTASALDSIVGEYDRVLVQDGFNPVTLEAGVAYWLRSTADASLTLGMIGTVYTETGAMALEPGWHWIGYCLGQSQPVTAALSSLAGSFDRVIGETGAYVPGLVSAYQSLPSMAFGQGYLIHVTEASTLAYPEPVPVVEPESSSTCDVVQDTPYSTLVYGSVRIEGAAAPPETVVQVLTPREEVAGCFEVRENGAYGLVSVYGVDDDGTTPGFADGEPLMIQVGDCVPATTELLWSNDYDAHELHVNVVDGVCQIEDLQSIYLPLVLRNY